MNTFIAMAKAEQAGKSGARHRVFDWDKAAKRIRESGAEEAGAGLHSDWSYTGGDIFKDGKPVPRDETYTYLCSNWAAPELSLDDVKEDCWRYVDETPGWDAHTYWPESALAILNATEAAR